MSHDGLTELSKAIECLLFTSAETLSADRLAEVLGANAHEVREAVELLRDTLDGRGLQIVELAGGYQLATRPEYARLVHKMLQPAPARLSAQALEVLAIVAYRQPITRPEIDAIRGVNSQHAVNSLAEKGIVTTVGRKNAPGRPLLYATTPHFLGTFGLRDLGGLPNLEELRAAVEAREPLVLRGVSQTGEATVPAQDEPAQEVSPAEDGGDGPEAPEQTTATGPLDE
jgi:segregation and condensation protein B